ncbi:TonB-dependent receptor [Zunongwangia sp. HGR-M22]|uniref:TonB-dependent receptor n=1 Tax=Zunongwangia sp. HGR-M22 TaxID=3015168 RepID=UPI0022DE5FA8|nr:TonB-dependent receptor [Zunongwangia sp. HGR-M22]WBL24969.1 TonB-dependent receptor [Zunongwangia sp. HGR-M22]
MKHYMNRNFTKTSLSLFFAGFSLFASQSIFAQEDKDKNISVQDSIALQQDLKGDKEVEGKKNGSDRNVMLNAANNSGPRDVNIGLPGSVGGITILENDLPVVYLFWPELPNKTWRQSVSLQKTGLLKMDELAGTMGDLGFAVNSYTQTGTEEFQLKGKLSGSHFGWFQGDINVSGPISENGWSYTAGAFVNFDPSTYDLGYNNYADQTKIFRAGLTKRFKDGKGIFNISYKYADSYTTTNYAVVEYGPDGEANEIDDFRIGRDSYIVRDGKVRFKDVDGGDYYWASMDGKENTNTSHNIDIFGNYLMDNGWNFKYSTRLHLAKASLLNIIPISILSNDLESDDPNYKEFRYPSNGDLYSGPVGTQLAMNSPEISTTAIMGRFSINKKIENHDVTLGVLEQYYHVDNYVSNRSLFYQTVENQPQRLIGYGNNQDLVLNQITDDYGFYGYNGSAEFHTGKENKLAAYASDDWQVSDRFNLSYGLFFRHHYINGEYSLQDRGVDFTIQDADIESVNKNWFHIAGKVNATYNVTNKFGVLANLQYTEENRRLESYSANLTPNAKTSKSPMGAFGVFYNDKWISLVSQVSYLTKNNYLKRFNLVNPDDDTQQQQTTTYYDIETLGWTTDVVLTPFKGFSFHGLVTVQDPKYKDFTFEAFGNTYDDSDKTVLEISKVLLELDPSYTYKDWRVWASFRYFSKQYANINNALTFAPRWENFGGVNYKYNDHLNFGLTLVNFLNQVGAKGTINGAELKNDPSEYYGNLLTSSYIRPFTAQLSVNFNF